MIDWGTYWLSETPSVPSYGWGKYGNSPSAPTWDGPVENCPMMIDYIYYSGFHKCLQFIVLDKKYVGVPYISDHYPIAAVLKF